MTHDDIHAFEPPRAASAGAIPPAAPRRPWWPWLLIGTLLLALLVMGALAAALAGLAEAVQHGWQVVINGREWDGADLGGLVFSGDLVGGALGVVLAVLAVLMLLLLVLPFVLLLAMLAVGGGVGVALAAVLLAFGLVAAIVLSPIWLLWLLLRRRPASNGPSNGRRAAPAGATMNP